MMKSFQLSLLLLSLMACSPADKNLPKKITIGFSQCTTGDDWRKTMNEEMLREISFYPDYDIELIIKDAQDNSDRQIQDIKALVLSGIDILIVSPNEAEPLTEIVKQVYEQGIPVIIIDRKINSLKFNAYIGANNNLIGSEAGQFAAELLKGEGKILEITGLSGSTPSMERSKGFHEVIKKYPGIQVHTVEGQWHRAVAQSITDTLFYRLVDIDLIYTHNDRMAYGAYLSAKKHLMKTHIIGIDGLNAPTPDGGIQMVLKGQIDGTFLYPTGGDKAIQLAIDILSGQPYERFNYLNTVRIDHTNARTLKLQGDQLNEQQAKIDIQRERMGEMGFLINRQRTFLILAISSVILLLMLAGLIVYFLIQKNHNNKILDIKNKTIEQQNRKISQKSDELGRMLKIAEEATEMKLRFFTNISHEFRTVLSLITLPVNDLVSSLDNGVIKEKLLTIKKSAERLLRLSDEILDFRKLEKHKYQLNSRNADIATYITEIVEAFLPKVLEKKLRLTSDIPSHLAADFDPGVIEKVMFNLLSNAIKYTHEGGEILVNVLLEAPKVIISVKDTGIGIPDHQIAYIFDPFYRVSNPTNDHEEPGSGVGLAFCKELIQLHGGNLSVRSKADQGSVFFITFPQFQPQLTKMAKAPDTGQELSHLQQDLIGADKKKIILIVEDNAELLSVLASMVDKYYTVLTAPDGKAGLEITEKNVPDLVVTDIFMPVMDGIELCNKIKKNPHTFHIPVILLTAIDSQESTIKSFDIGADDYMTKPINENILISRINNLIASREKLKSTFEKSLIGFEMDNCEKEEQDFINECVKIIYDKVSEESFHLDELAHLMNVSRSSLYRKIKDITGLKAVDFMKKVRLQYAAKLLLNKDLTISEIAWLSGFSDVKYFSKCFAKEFGHNPSHFKNIILSGKSVDEFVNV
jgi:signal transduction histidine kinase/DNA-binding response OmpR family regulator